MLVAHRDGAGTLEGPGLPYGDIDGRRPGAVGHDARRPGRRCLLRHHPSTLPRLPHGHRLRRAIIRVMVRVGGLSESPDDVLGRAKLYFQSADAAKPFAYPSYDAYDTRATPTELVDADLLAPLLLNAA